jgi:hypothetical protein
MVLVDGPREVMMNEDEDVSRAVEDVVEPGHL